MPEEDSQTSNEKAHSGDRPRLRIWLILSLVVIYFLSPGPFIKVVGRRPGRAAAATARVLYAPLGYLMERVPAVKSFYDWYGKLWRINR